jgi:phenylacetate-CoA ligase
LKNNNKVTGIKHLFTTSTPLSLNARNKIEKAFGNKVMDQYDSCGIFSTAQQCLLCNGLHINSDIVHVDIVDTNNHIVKDYSIGDVIVTNMKSFAFPLIKYRIEDRSNFIESKNKLCNLPFPLMNFVSGRISDTLTTPSGIILNGDYLTTIFDDCVDNVFAFQVCQK